MPSKSSRTRKAKSVRKSAPARKAKTKPNAKTKTRPKAKAASKPARRTKPAKAPQTSHFPKGMRSVTPHLVCAGAADAIEFYKQAFGAVENMRIPGPGGKIMHASIRIGDSVIMLVDEMPEWETLGPKTLKGSPVTIHLYVENVDAFVARAVEAGAKLTMPVEDAFWGDRYGKLEDPFGHQWSVATFQREVSPAELQAAMEKMCAEPGAASGAPTQ
jgi:uncharacterized glyoxalase superfamily protein PhnB